MAFATPPPMEPGDRVAVLAPSSGGARFAPHVFERGLERLRAVFDLEPVVYPTARQSDDFLEANPRARAVAVHEAFRDPAIGGVVATIGGWDELRILRYLDTDVLREHPTRFYGMSDNTVLALALYDAGVVSYNGAQLMNELGIAGSLPEYTERYARRAFFEPSLGELVPSTGWTDEPTTWWTDRSRLSDQPEYQRNPGWRWHGGDRRVEGRLWGGCRAVVQWLLAADRHVPEPEELEGAILGLEVAETLPSPEAVGATLRALAARGLLERFGAVLVGRVPGRSHLDQKPPDERAAYRESMRETVATELDRYNPDAPVVFGLDWGHTNPVAPLPIGGRVVVDPDHERIAFPVE